MQNMALFPTIVIKEKAPPVENWKWSFSLSFFGDL